MKKYAFTIILAAALVASGATNLYQWQLNHRLRDWAENLRANAVSFADSNDRDAKAFAKKYEALKAIEDQQSNKLKESVLASDARAQKRIVELEKQRSALIADIMDLRRQNGK